MVTGPARRLAAPATMAIVAVCVAIEIVYQLAGAGFSQTLALSGGLIPARLTGAAQAPPGLLPPLATLVTHQFLHAGPIHLGMNMLFLVAVGRPVESAIGSARFLLLYLLGGIGGGLLQVALTPASILTVVGASGAISAVFATYALLFARSAEDPVELLGVRLSGATVRALRLAALWIGLQLIVGAVFNLPGSGGGIAIWAHIGGFLVGLLFALPWLRRQRA